MSIRRITIKSVALVVAGVYVALGLVACDAEGSGDTTLLTEPPVVHKHLCRALTNDEPMLTDERFPRGGLIQRPLELPEDPDMQVSVLRATTGDRLDVSVRLLRGAECGENQTPAGAAVWLNTVADLTYLGKPMARLPRGFPLERVWESPTGWTVQTPGGSVGWIASSVGMTPVPASKRELRDRSVYELCRPLLGEDAGLHYAALEIPARTPGGARVRVYAGSLPEVDSAPVYVAVVKEQVDDVGPFVIHTPQAVLKGAVC